MKSLKAVTDWLMGQSILHQLPACTVSLHVQKLASPGGFAVQIHTSEDTAMCSTGNFHEEHTWDNSDSTAIFVCKCTNANFILETEKEECENQLPSVPLTIR